MRLNTVSDRCFQKQSDLKNIFRPFILKIIISQILRNVNKTKIFGKKIYCKRIALVV